MTGIATAVRGEAIVDPGRVIVDAHHHLYDRPGTRYLLEEFEADLSAGHDVRATVLVQARYAYDAQARVAMRPVGETRFGQLTAQRAIEGTAARFGVATAIVPFADLLLGDDVKPVLEAHLAAGGGRVRGIRHVLAWHRDPGRLNAAYPTTEAMMDSSAFRAGFRHLASLGLSFDAWLLFPQLPLLARLARAFPDTPIVVDHCGGPLVGGNYQDQADSVFAFWRVGIRGLAACPNVSIKLSGLGMPSAGFPRAADSHQLAGIWRPWMETCIEAFGPKRAMFASNFPADRLGYDYALGWNAMKRLATSYSEDEQAHLFSGSAARFYRLAIASGQQEG